MGRLMRLAAVAALGVAACAGPAPVQHAPTTRTRGESTAQATGIDVSPPSAAAATPAPTRPPTSASAPSDLARAVLSRMSLEQKVGQVFMLGFDGTALDEGNRALVHDLHLGGVTLFGRNVESPAQVAALTRGLQSVADPVPLFVSIDQEGGLVVRITDAATIFPGNMALGATGDPELARQVAAASVQELRAMGINMNLAPVVDVNTNPKNPVIGVRSFGSDPARVAQFGVAIVAGLQDGGVSAVVKHFPGHGDTSVDSHLDLPVVPHPLDRLESVEWPPFEAAIAAGTDGVMTAHVYVPTLEPQPNLPATLSKAVLTGVLRDRLGYQGLILTDALDMGAIKRGRTAAEAAVQALEAGGDVLVIAGITPEDRAHLADGPKALLAAVQSGRVSEARLDQSVERILETKARRGLRDPSPPAAPDLSSVGSQAHRDLAWTAEQRATTLIRDDAHLLPLKPAQQIAVVQPSDPTRSDVEEEQGQVASLASAIARFAPGAVEIDVTSSPSSASIDRVVEQARKADAIVLATYNLTRNPAQVALADALVATGKPVVGVAVRTPYDASAAPAVPTYLAVYGDRPDHLRAAAEALFGSFVPNGRLPVALP